MASPREPVLERLLTVNELAALLRISLAKAYQMTQSGEIPTVRIGRNVRIRQDRLERWLDDQR